MRMWGFKEGGIRGQSAAGDEGLVQEAGELE